MLEIHFLRYYIPMNFQEHLKKYLKEDEINKLLSSLEDSNKNSLLLNTDKLSVEKLKALYPNIIPHPVVTNGFIYDKNEYQLGKSILHELGAFYLQEPSAMVVSALMDIKPGELVLDMCAAPGGKTIQAALKMHNKGLIVSNDLSRERATIIKENAERMGIGNLVIISVDFATCFTKYKNTFDKIILDAPCSGSGMFRKNEAMKEDWNYNKVLKYQAVQKDLLSMAYSMLKPGGVISYSTCSFSYEEDEEVVQDLLDNTDAELIELPNNPLFYKSESGIGIHLFPHIFPGEGHYICHIKKPGELVKKEESVKTNSLIQKYGLETDYPYLSKIGEFLLIYDKEISLKNIPIIRYGVKVGEEIATKEIKYDLHYARYISHFPNVLEINEEDTKKYLKGESLNIVYPKGYVLLKYLGVNIDIAKSDGRIIKNRYPKYLKYKKL